MKHAIKHIHFVGIGGSGMSPIAEILHNLGYRVSGSDQSDSSVAQRLAALGIAVHIGHRAAHIAGAQAVVTSTAVKGDNPEVLAARAARVPVVARAVLLAELMRHKLGIAIAGTHGKTTTTSLVASVLAQAGVDPTFVIGGRLMSAGANARLGAGEHIVVEADESDASFLHLSPVISVVTNIDADHMETYGHSLPRLHAAFVAFIHRLPFYGRAVLCADDAGVQAVLPQLARPITTYGLDAGADVRAVDVRAAGGARMAFTVQQSGHADLAITLNLAGAHNVRNALAAIAVARELELPDAPIAAALAAFQGVGRRFERHGAIALAGTAGCQAGSGADGHVDSLGDSSAGSSAGSGADSFTLIDDYGHHPAEMAAVLAAARGAFPGQRLVLAFQPHRYSRTRDCFAAFAGVLQGFDQVLLTQVYAAGEQPITGADGQSLAAAVPGAVFVADVHDLAQAVLQRARAGDVVLTMGAGSIAAVPAQIKALAGVQATAPERAHQDVVQAGQQAGLQAAQQAAQQAAPQAVPPTAQQAVPHQPSGATA